MEEDGRMFQVEGKGLCKNSLRLHCSGYAAVEEELGKAEVGRSPITEGLDNGYSSGSLQLGRHTVSPKGPCWPWPHCLGPEALSHPPPLDRPSVVPTPLSTPLLRYKFKSPHLPGH